MMQDPYLPPGYTGVDAPTRHVYLECPQGHVWPTREYHEFGTVGYSLPECPHCDMDGRPTDADAPNAIATNAQCHECLEWLDIDEIENGICTTCTEDKERSQSA